VGLGDCAFRLKQEMDSLTLVSAVVRWGLDSVERGAKREQSILFVYRQQN